MAYNTLLLFIGLVAHNRTNLPLFVALKLPLNIYMKIGLTLKAFKVPYYNARNRIYLTFLDYGGHTEVYQNRFPSCGFALIPMPRTIPFVTDEVQLPE